MQEGNYFSSDYFDSSDSTATKSRPGQDNVVFKPVEKDERTLRKSVSKPYAVKGGNIYYNDVKCTLTACDISVTEAIIPSELGIQMIEKDAFKGCTVLRSLSIPETVTGISKWAFDGSAIKNIRVNKHNPVYCDIDGVLYRKDRITLEHFPCGRDGEYNIPEGTVNIEEFAFSMSPLITEVTVPSSVVNISKHVFEGCSSLIRINVDTDNEKYCDVDGVLYSKAHGALVAYPNSHGSSCVIPSSVISIREGAFTSRDKLKYVYCVKGSVADNLSLYVEGVSIIYTAGARFAPPSLPYPAEGGNIYIDIRHGKVIDSDKTVTRVDIPSELEGTKVTGIASFAFDGCRELRLVTLPETMSDVGVYSFENCSNLAEIKVSPDNKTYSDIGGVLFDISKQRLIYYPLNHASSYTVPEGVKEISFWAFRNCYNLTKIEMPASVIKINDNAFIGCKRLEKLTFEASAIQISTSGFDMCDNIRKVECPKNAIPNFDAVFDSDVKLKSLK
jgi:hypothetical protein